MKKLEAKLGEKPAFPPQFFRHYCFISFSSFATATQQ
jgi:hypothetical protein